MNIFTFYTKLKVKFTLELATNAQKGGRDIALLFLHPLSLYSRNRRLGEQGQSGRMRKISPSPAFNPWTTQPIESWYADYSTLTHHFT